MSGAEYLSSIFGTEKDKVNCPFYFKIGACRHGDKCERRHNKPTLSQTLLLVGLYTNPATQNLDEKTASQEFINFYEDIYDELTKYGEIEELNVCDNVCEHMIGNVYVKYRREEEAEKALKALTGRFYGGKPLVAEFSPVTDFRESSCRQYEMHECTRGGHCNFMHLKPISRDLYKSTFGHKSRRRQKERSEKSERSGSRERKRSRSPRKHRSRSRDRKDKDDKKKRRTRSRSRERERSGRTE